MQLTQQQGGLLVKAPSIISGDLTQLGSISWDEYIPYRSTTDFSTFVLIEGSDGTFYKSDTSLITTNSWNTKSASFLNSTDWTLSGSGTSSFDDVVTSATALYFSMDTSSQASGGVESRIDNVEFFSSPVPVPGTIWLLGSGLIGFGAFRRKKKII